MAKKASATNSSDATSDVPVRAPRSSLLQDQELDLFTRNMNADYLDHKERHMSVCRATIVLAYILLLCGYAITL